MVSVEQLTALIDYLEVHQELAFGRCARTKEGRSLMKRLWIECANILNSTSVDCTQKTAEQWRVYYNEYKSKLLKKVKTGKAELVATGGGPAKKIEFTNLQEKLLNILGTDYGEPLPGVRHNPIPQTENEACQPSTSREAEQFAFYSINPNNEVATVAEVPEIAVSELTVSEATWVASSPGQYGDPLEHSSLPADQQPPSAVRNDRQTPRRRRRRRNTSFQQVTDPAMNEVTARLENMERMSAEATRELAAATYKLAAAIDSLAIRIQDPIVVVLANPPQTRCD